MNRMLILLALLSVSAGAVSYPAPKPLTDAKLKGQVGQWLKHTEMPGAKGMTCQGEYSYAQFPLAPVKSVDEALSRYVQQHFKIQRMDLYSTWRKDGSVTTRQFAEAFAKMPDDTKMFFFHTESKGKLLETYSCRVKAR